MLPRREVGVKMSRRLAGDSRERGGVVDSRRLRHTQIVAVNVHDLRFWYRLVL